MADDIVFGSDKRPVSLDPFGTIVEVSFAPRRLAFTINIELVFADNFPAQQPVGDVTWGGGCTPSVVDAEVLGGPPYGNNWLEHFQIKGSRSTSVSLHRSGRWEGGGPAKYGGSLPFPKDVTLTAWQFLARHPDGTAFSGPFFGIEWEDQPAAAPVTDGQGNPIYPESAQSPFRRMTSARVRARGWAYTSGVVCAKNAGVPLGGVGHELAVLQTEFATGGLLTFMTNGTLIAAAQTSIPLGSMTVTHAGRKYIPVGTHVDRLRLTVLCERPKTTA